MKKIILKRILMLVIVITMIISIPFSVFGKLYNNDIYVYASTSVLEDELLKQTFIPLLISSGLVFTSKESIDDVWQKLNDYWVANDTYLKYWQHGPEDPQPDLKTVLMSVLAGQVIWDNIKETYKWIINLPNSLWEDVKGFVDDNYDVGSFSSGIIYASSSPIYPEYMNFNVLAGEYWYIYESDGKSASETPFYFDSNESKPKYPWGQTYDNPLKFCKDSNGNFGFILNGSFSPAVSWAYFVKYDNFITPTNLNPDTLEPDIIGTDGIVDNSNYDWNNNYTGTKTIPIPIQSDNNGNPKVDSNGNYLPTIDTEEWVQVTPEEIPNLNPTGLPNPNVPDMPIIEDPDEQTGIIIYIGNILQLIVGQLSKIVEGIATITARINQMVYNIPNPVFDPVTNEALDPATGEPIPEIVPDSGGSIIGDGIDTSIPEDFEWGDFKHLLDIFFIFIYFIVILILILLKFLNVVFMSLPSIPANTELFNQYPEILEGVNFVKNLKVGGMSITVQQSFEMIFLIFFFIFAIKQIRKLYGASVFEQAAESKRNTKDMKMDYYENSKQNEPINYWKEIEHSNDVKSKSYNDDDYENIHFDGF